MVVVYAFLTQGFFDDNGSLSRILKVGRTNDWEQRQEAYTGLDKPDDSTLLVKETLNSELLEKTLIRMLCEMFAVHSGYERFIVPILYAGNNSMDRHHNRYSSIKSQYSWYDIRRSTKIQKKI